MSKSKFAAEIGHVVNVIVDVLSNRDGSVAEHATLPLIVTSVAEDGTVSGHVLPNSDGESTFVSGVTVHNSTDDALGAYTHPDHNIAQDYKHAIAADGPEISEPTPAPEPMVEAEPSADAPVVAEAVTEYTADRATSSKNDHAGEVPA